MKRVFKGFVLFSLGLVVAFAASAWRRPAKADITTELATRIIDVEFDDWVLVYTNLLLQTSNPDYNVLVTKEVKAGGVRFHVVGSYANTPAGLRWYQATGSKIHERLETICRPWKDFGYKISADDFEIEIHKAPVTEPPDESSSHEIWGGSLQARTAASRPDRTRTGSC